MTTKLFPLGILTPEQIEAISFDWQNGRCSFRQAFDMLRESHEALRAELDQTQKDLAAANGLYELGARLYVELEDRYGKLAVKHCELEARYAAYP